MSTGGAGPDPNARSPLAPGHPVDVRNRYQGTWVRGFEVAEFTGGGYRIRRLSDGSILGELFARDDVRRERSRRASGGTDPGQVPAAGAPSR